MTVTATARLARWALDLATADLPGDVIDTVTLHLLDGVGCAVAGHGEPAAIAALEVAGLTPAPAEATVIGSPTRLPAPAAALANGTLVHALDFDDTHPGGLVHATAAVLPVAFAVGEEVGARGGEVLTAVAAGYEAVCRLAAAVPHGFHERGFHATSVCGVFAAALVAARLLRLDQATTTHALGIAGSAAAGSLEFLRSPATTKQLHPGLAAQAGITAARLARAGASGPATILEGDQGLYRAYAASAVDAEAITAGLGDRWELSSMAIKPFPACQLSHATLHAAAEARARLGAVEPGAIESVTVTLPHESMPIVAEPVAAKRRPATPYEAKFSVQWSTAAMLLDGSVGPSTYEPQHLTRPDAAALADKIEVVAEKSDTVAADAGGHITVRPVTGEAFTVEVPAHHGVSQETTLEKYRLNGGSGATADAILGLAGLAPSELGRALEGARA